MKSPSNFFFRLINCRIHRLFAAMLLFAAVGCGGPEQVQYNPAWVLDEHGNPDFKPEGYHQAIEKLKADFQVVSKAQAAQRPDLIQIYQQIIRWLPEFAADTEIRRSQWESLEMKSTELLAASSGAGFFNESGQNSVMAQLDELAAMVPPEKKTSQSQNNQSPKPQ